LKGITDGTCGDLPQRPFWGSIFHGKSGVSDPKRLSTFLSILDYIPARIMAAMFEALRAATFFGLLAAGILTPACKTGPGVFQSGY
jgi:hypothetical protein